MERDQLRRLLQPRELVLQPLLLGAQSRQLAGRFLLVDDPVNIAAIGAVIDPLGSGKPLLSLGALVDDVGGQPQALVVIGFHIERDGLTLAELGLQALDDRGLDILKVVGAAIRAGARFKCLRAADARAVGAAILHGHAGPAGAATQEAGEQMLGPRPIAWVLLNPLAPALLHGVVGLTIDDRQFRRILLLPLGLAVDARDPLAGAGVLHHPHAIPDALAGIDRIEQQAMAALAVAVDRDGSPERATRRRHALGVEAAGNGARRFAGEIFREDPAHDRGLFLDDLQLARLPSDGTIAIGPPAGAAPVPDHTGEAAPDLLRQPLEEERRHRALEADMHFADLAIRHGDELHAGELRGFIEPGDIGEVARETVEILGQDRVELAGEREPDQPLIVQPAMDRGAGGGAIGEDVGDGEAEAVSMRAAQRDLVLDRSVTLQVG